MQRSAPALKTIPVCATYSCARQLDNLSVDDSRASQSLSLLLSIILGSAVKTTSVQVTAKTMKTILCAHRVHCRPCPSPKAVIRATLIELLRRRTQCRRQEHNQRRPGRRSKSAPCLLPTAVFAWKLSFEMEIWTKAMTSYDLHGNVCYCVYFLSFSGTL